MPGEQVLGPPHQQRVRARLINGHARRPEPHHRRVDVMQRIRRIARRVLDRQPRHAGFNRQPNALRDALRVGEKPAFEVSIDRQAGRRRMQLTR